MDTLPAVEPHVLLQQLHIERVESDAPVPSISGNGESGPLTPPLSLPSAAPASPPCERGRSRTARHHPSAFRQRAPSCDLMYWSSGDLDLSRFYKCATLRTTKFAVNKNNSEGLRCSSAPPLTHTDGCEPTPRQVALIGECDLVNS